MNAKKFLILSLAANVLLGMLALRSSPAPTEPPSKNPPPPAATANKAAIAQDTSSDPASAPAATTGTAEPMTWEKVESADYKQYIENLRSIGVPEETIRDIILADVEKLLMRCLKLYKMIDQFVSIFKLIDKKEVST